MRPRDRAELGTTPPVTARKVHVRPLSSKTAMAAQLTSLAQTHLQASAISAGLTMPGRPESGSRV